MTAEIGDDPLFRNPDFASFYDIENGDEAESGRDDFAFCRALARDASSVLDLGCGTGELAASLAPGRRVVGADPAGAMLDVARQRPDGDKVRWMEANAQQLRLGETFDLILLTGHAFQVFLTDDEVRAVLKTIVRHLAPKGRFIFDSRNPAREEWRTWTPDLSERVVDHPAYGKVRAWNDVSFDSATAIATYQTFYELKTIGKTLSAASRIRFIEKDRLADLTAKAGLEVDHWLGDWKGSVYETGSKEIVPVGRLA
jgi:ubiquinone/menaquinone biosynthesis C-methylase UbiE